DEGELDHAAVQVGVVLVDDQVGVAPDGEPLTGEHGELLAAELDDQRRGRTGQLVAGHRPTCVQTRLLGADACPLLRISMTCPQTIEPASTCVDQEVFSAVTNGCRVPPTSCSRPNLSPASTSSADH